MKLADCRPGTKVGRLTVMEVVDEIKYFPSQSGPRLLHRALCKCECGGEAKPYVHNLGNNAFSCGCYCRDRSAESIVQRTRTHGLSVDYPRAYRIAKGAKARCTKPTHKNWDTYGGRGIEFRFVTLADMCRHIVFDVPDGLLRWNDRQYSIDRIDNTKHYEAGNLRWATQSEQCFNRRPKRTCRAK